MASTKVPTKNVVSFFELRKRCPTNQVDDLRRFNEKRSAYVLKLQETTAELPRIDWEYYKRNVRTESVSLVEDFEKKYKGLTIPYPVDKLTPEIERIKKEVQKDVAEFVEKSNQRIAGYQKEIDEIQKMMPFEQMTWEDYIDLFPERAPNFRKNPTFWPHDAEEQPGNPEEAPDHEKH